MSKVQSHDEFVDDSFLRLLRSRLSVVLHMSLYQGVCRKGGKQTELSSHGSSRNDSGQFARVITGDVCSTLNANCLQARRLCSCLTRHSEQGLVQ